MLPTSDDFEPRRDGWFEHRGTWGEVVLGTVIGVREKRSQAWEIVDVSQATQVQYGYTLWMRARERTTGQEFTLEPRPKINPVIILTDDPADTATGPIVPPSDADAIMELVSTLGATLLASRDNETGEIVCPDYIDRGHLEGFGERKISRGLGEHMRVAHGHPVADDIDFVSLVNIHGQSHDHRWPNIGKGGFPHRHVPEDPALY